MTFRGLLILAVVMCAHGAHANGVINGSFEEEFLPDDWGTTWGSFDAEDWNSPPEGQMAGYIKGTWFEKGDSGGALQHVDITAGATYELSAYLYKDGGWFASYQILKVEFFDDKGTMLHAESNKLVDLPTKSWTHVRLTAVAPQTAVRALIVFEAAQVGSAGALGIDDVQLTR